VVYALARMTSTKKNSRAKAYSVPAIHRTLDIIEALVQRRTLTVSEINRRFKIPKSSAYAILHTLKSRGYVEKDEMDRYSLRLRLFSLGNSLIEGLDVRKIAYPLLKELTEEAQLTGHIAIQDGEYAVYIEKREVLGSVRLTTWLGRRVHLHSTAIGKALLAFLPEEEIDQIVGKRSLLRLTPKTITSATLLKKELARVRAHGYAVGNEENETGVRAVAAPIFNDVGRVVAAVNLGASTLHMRGEDVPRLGSLVRRYSLKMSELLGYRPVAQSARR
jgi:IclR family transcriptional regulator, KDG regulon repressor